MQDGTLRRRNLDVCIYHILLLLFWNIDLQKVGKIVQRVPCTAHPASPNGKSDIDVVHYQSQGTDIVILTVNQPLLRFHHFLTCIHMCVYIYFFEILFHVQIHVAITTTKIQKCANTTKRLPVAFSWCEHLLPVPIHPSPHSCPPATTNLFFISRGFPSQECLINRIIPYM